MLKSDAGKLIRSIKTSVIKHSPEILTGIGIAGMVSATVMAVKATPKALDVMAELKEERADKPDDVRSMRKETIKRVFPVYVPTIVTTGVSIACLIGAASTNARRNAALATAYSLSETAMKEYQSKVIETVGKKKERDIRDAVAKERVEKNPIGRNEIVITKRGDTVCYDVLSGRYFKSDVDTIKRIVNELNARLISEMYISLNEFYYELGLSDTKQGNDLGWNLGDGLIDVRFSAQILDDNQPCIVLDYGFAPRYDFRNLI